MEERSTHVTLLWPHRQKALAGPKIGGNAPRRLNLYPMAASLLDFCSIGRMRVQIGNE
jgi:hypothetical protein